MTRRPSRREISDKDLKPQVRRVWEANFRVYGSGKVWLILNREGIAVARCTVERLMRELGLVGARRGAVRRTTIADRAAQRAQDLALRNFRPPAPDRLWVADLRLDLVGVYVAFLTDAYARRILGWRTGQFVQPGSPSPTSWPGPSDALFLVTPGNMHADIVHKP